jgi:iron complex outermembrane receptor protein
LAGGAIALAPTYAAADVASVSDLSRLSIEELANVPVTSASKSAESLSDAVAAIYVISHEEIRRSGATTLPEILRLAPNLEVAQVSGSGYAITARGFNGTTTTNGAGNKLLVLIDGRTVYTPLYGGVFWDLQNVLPEDIDHIEVISGPGAALWGANAVNGVINIITRNSGDTQGLSLSIDGGSLEYGASAQFGGAISPDATFRVYAQAYDRGDDETTSGTNAHDSWNKLQGGFRVDWHPGDALVTFQGDAFTGREEQNAPPNAVIGGVNLLGRWTQPFNDGSSLQVQGYYDYNTLYLPGSLGDALSTFDLDIQHSFSWGSWNDIVWGGGARIYTDRYSNIASIQFLPPVTTQSLENVFFQDTMAVSNSVKLILGAKLEDDPFVGLQPLPNARISWKPSDTSLVWAAVSRAVRAPTLWDRDLNELIGGATILGGGDFQSEKLIAFEAGYRAQPLPNLSFSLSTYYNVYNDLRSFNFSSSPLFPFVYGNDMEGDTYGAEFWGSYRVADWWRLSAGFNVLEENLRFKPGSVILTGTQIAGNDPSHQVTLKSSWDLPHDVEFDIDARYIGALPNPAVPAYWGLDARVGWQMTDHFELALSGTNLAGKHTEFGPIPGGYVFGPTVLLALKWKP